MVDSPLGSPLRWSSELSSPPSRDGMSVHIDLLRDWALSRQTSNSRAMTELEEISHIILRSPKLPDGDMPLPDMMQQLDVIEASSKRGFRQSQHWPPRVSRLGAATPPWMEGRQTAIVGLSQLARPAVVAKQVELKRPQRPRSAREARATVETIVEPRRSPRPFLISAAPSSQPRRRHLIVGNDLFAGSPFSTDAQLDPLTQRIGIYNVQCRNGRHCADRCESLK